MKPFFPDQDRAIDFALARDGCNIFARPGKGKTRIALEIINSTGLRTLILAPLFPALTVWEAEKDKWGYDFDMRVLHGKNRTIGTESVSVLNYDGMPWALENLDFSSYGLVVYDEVSKMKNPGTVRFRRWRKIVRKYFNYRLGLTGTPQGNKLQDLWGEMFVVDKGVSLGTSVTRFKQEYFIPHPYIKNMWEPRDGIEDTIYDLIKPWALSLDREPGDLPPLIHNRIKTPMPLKARKLYEELKRSSEIDGTEVFAVNAGVRSSKLRQAASGSVYDTDGNVLQMHNSKVLATKNLVEECQGDPIIIFYEFNHSLDALRGALGDKVPAINGATKPDEMVRLVKLWNAGETPVLLAHVMKAGYGGNLQESSNTVCFYDLPWSLELVEQDIGRVWRHGQERPVTVHYMTVPDTKDEEVFCAVEAKGSDQDKLFKRLAV